ncbi:MAG: RDD family protein [Wenzhouxiangellaceae bacterium]
MANRSVTQASRQPPRCCPLLRRLASASYDMLIVIAIWMVGSAALVIPAGGAVESGNLLFQLYLLSLALAYLCASWMVTGQTLGMRAWHLRLEPAASKIDLRACLLRFMVGLVSTLPLGLGFAWALLRKDRATWHDLASGTRLVDERDRDSGAAQQD